MLVFGLAFFVGQGILAFGQGAGAHPAREQHVLVIWLDGMGANFYAHTPKAYVPTLERLRAEGSFAEGVEGVYPTVTYPSHTMIVTGRSPAAHGIYSNLSSRQAGKSPDDWSNPPRNSRWMRPTDTTSAPRRRVVRWRR